MRDRGRSLSAAGRECFAVLLRLAYLGLTNALTMLRLPPLSEHAKDVEIPALRGQITGLCCVGRSKNTGLAPNPSASAVIP